MRKILPLISLLLLLCACGGKPDKISEIKDPTPADSMMYYFGIMQANNFWQDAENDTILRTPEGKDQFLRGFRAALGMESDNDCYNRGLQLGLRLAIRLRQFEKDYGVEFSEDILAATLAQYLEGDSAIDISAAQKGYYKIKDLLDLKKGVKEGESAKKALAQRAKDDGYVMVSDTLFAKDVTAPGAGPKFKDGDRISIQLNTATLDGRELGRQFPDSLTIGEGRVPRTICLAIHTMTNGQTRMFMTTPQTLFGNQYSKYQLRSDEPVVFTVKATRN